MPVSDLGLLWRGSLSIVGSNRWEKVGFQQSLLQACLQKTALQHSTQATETPVLHYCDLYLDRTTVCLMTHLCHWSQRGKSQRLVLHIVNDYGDKKLSMGTQPDHMELRVSKLEPKQKSLLFRAPSMLGVSLGQTSPGTHTHTKPLVLNNNPQRSGTKDIVSNNG